MIEINCSINDFTEKETNNNYGFKKYIPNNNCIILGKTLDKEFIEIEIDKKIKLEAFIYKINEYVQWLGYECINEFIKYFHENEYIENGYINENNIKELEIKNIIITIVNDGNIYCEICFRKNIFCIGSMEINNKIIEAVV